MTEVQNSRDSDKKLRVLKHPLKGLCSPFENPLKIILKKINWYKTCWQATATLHTAEFGWGTWIRTKIDGVRVRCSTIKLFPNKPVSPLLADFSVQARIKKNLYACD